MFKGVVVQVMVHGRLECELAESSEVILAISLDFLLFLLHPWAPVEV